MKKRGGVRALAGVASKQPVESSPESRKRAAAGLIQSHDAVFRRTARRYSICADDAEDAYQRSLEILLTKAPPIEGDNLVRWMQTVTKREALGVRRQRERLLSGPDLPPTRRTAIRSTRSPPTAPNPTTAPPAASESRGEGGAPRP